MAKVRRKGRRQGSRNTGFFFRTGRGWGCKDSRGRFVALKNETGERLRDPADKQAADDAYTQWKATAKHKPTTGEPVDTIKVWEICQRYVSSIKGRTFDMRSKILFDFCTGLPPLFMGKDGKPKRATKADQIHPGLAQLTVGELKKHHVQDWITAHPDWNGSIRTQLQAVKRAFNYATESELISRNPIRGFKTPKANARATYLTHEQEQAIYKRAKPAFATAVNVLIETGARPGIEFSKLTARHVADNGDKMTWTFQPDECKTHVLRTIYISDPTIIAIVRKQVELHPTGPIFRTPTGKPWTIANLSTRFRTIKRRLAKEGIKLDDDACIYSTRHTFAKRMLEGSPTRRPVSLQTVAKLMGNSPEICQKHYGKWDDSQTDHLWAALQ
jgi:integrase